MPHSKRDKKVSLTKTPKKGMKMKQQLVEDIRKHLEIYSNLYVFTVHNMRNGPLKELREEWKDSRFFFAKRKVMAIALGRTEAEETQKNLHMLALQLVGQCGLLFTNKPKDQVLQWFRDYSTMDYAKSGFVATQSVTLPEGPLEEFTFAIEPHLRALGLPTKLEKGKVVLREPHVVCTEGARLTPEQARILKLLGKPMAEFKLSLICMWSKDGSFEKFKVPKKFKVTPKKIIETSKPEETTPKQKEKNSPPQKELKRVDELSEQEKPRRSMRTPKPVLRTPIGRNDSIKKITKSATKQANRTPKQGSVKKPKMLRPSLQSEDVEIPE